jgi:hypothetical protein
MSAPMVSGAVALLLEKYPHLTPNQVKGVLKASARALPGQRPGRRRPARIDSMRSSWSRSSWSTSWTK